ncbi:GNAT family N-acetyltransferase [Paracoccus sp. (in: a-proteobacteria)]|uniref:GNAT family N-acetyltransferase n=1 Tax=Paracoccus sp. TaxID=267 RepID=UPI0026DF73A1|nr:GNAT family N-acetyltransferase [Paracoccus sp. (in: a-proteobacteria)]MDO5648917.1 GNAT family N-acetyltransferase [Paracoccus sp. (in: a-proteobacteria)]
MIRVGESERGRALAALRDAPAPIFLQSNLAQHGLAGDHPHALHLWRNADFTAFAGLTVSGVLMPQMAGASDADWRGLAEALSGRAISGMNGDAAQLLRLMDLLALHDAPVQMQKTEPGFDLALSDLIVPDMAGLRLIPARADLRDMLIDWRSTYLTEVQNQPADTALTRAAGDIDLYLAAGSHRVLYHHDQPVALTGFNAELPHQVQIGGVFTPHALRGRGYARAAVAAHLVQARDRGVTRANLFAANDAAARAYVAIGFRPAAPVRLVIFATPQVP